ncbi:MAG: Gfo/Idh/MocA family protein [Spirochaetota bacterium]
MEDSVQPIRVGIVGCGERGIYVLGLRAIETKEDTGIEIRALYDINRARVLEGKEFLEARYRERGMDISIDVAVDYHEIVQRSDIDCVFITSYTSEHRDPTVAALNAGKQVYLDKPISTTIGDARDIMEAETATGLPVIMGFTRRYENSWRKAVELLRDGRIGALQTILLRSVIPYARYLQRWHRANDRSGGALNDKVSHYFDALNWIAGSTPASLGAFGGRSEVFAPDPTAPRYCRECDRICPFRAAPSPWVSELGTVYRLEPDYRSVIERTGALEHFELPSWGSSAEADHQRIDNCVYRSDSDIIDHANVLIQYRNGIQASLFWNIFGPSSEDQETLELVGSSGRLRVTRLTGEIDLVSNYGEHRETIDAKGPDFESSHFGADTVLLQEIRRHADGSHPVAGTKDGYESLRMVLATHESIQAGGKIISLEETET